jgi:head-tail adaptor
VEYVGCDPEARAGDDERAANEMASKEARAWMRGTLKDAMVEADRAQGRDEFERFALLVDVILKLEDRLSWADAQTFEIKTTPTAPQKRQCVECGAREGDGTPGCIETYPATHSYVTAKD